MPGLNSSQCKSCDFELLSVAYLELEKPRPPLKAGEIEAANTSIYRSRPPHSIRSNVSPAVDRKSTRLNSSHLGISYAVFCLKKKKKKNKLLNNKLKKQS